MAMVFATKQEIENLKNRIDQLDADMAAIAIAIKRNNDMTQSILDAIEAEKSTKEPVLIGAN